MESPIINCAGTTHDFLRPIDRQKNASTMGDHNSFKLFAQDKDPITTGWALSTYDPSCKERKEVTIPVRIAAQTEDA
jgi:hypothetical protein